MFETGIESMKTSERRMTNGTVTTTTVTRNPHMKLYNTVVEEKIIIEQVDNSAVRLAREAKAALERQYRDCVNSLNDLNRWLESIERRLASQERMQETVTELKKQCHTVKIIRDEIVDKMEVTEVLTQIKHLLEKGPAHLPPEDLENLAEEGRELKGRYDRVWTTSEEFYRHLITASDELYKFKAEATSFSGWMESAFSSLEEGERKLATISLASAQSFVQDIVAHQGDLRFITMSSQRFLQESESYHRSVSEFRGSSVHTTESTVRREVETLTSSYNDLLSRANKLLDAASSLEGKHKAFDEALNKAMAWLQEITPRVQKHIKEPPGKDPNTIQDQLRRAKGLQAEIASGQRLMDDCKWAGEALLKVPELPASERDTIQKTLTTLDKRYQELKDAMLKNIALLESALDKTAELTAWLTDAEYRLRGLDKASLIREELSEQIKELSQIERELSQKMQGVPKSAHDLVTRFEHLFTQLEKKTNSFSQISHSLDKFLQNFKQLDTWFGQMLRGNLGPDQLAMEAQGNLPLFQLTVGLGRDLISRNDVKNTHNVRDKVEQLEDKWAKLQELLENGAGLQQELNNLADWLKDAEYCVNKLDKASLIREILEEQMQVVHELEEEIESKLRHVQSLSSTSPALSGQIKETHRKIEALRVKVSRHSELLKQVAKELDHFERNAESLESWLHDMLSQGPRQIKKEGKEAQFKETISHGKRLIARKDVKDTHQVEERIRQLEAAWAKLAEMGNAFDAYKNLLNDFKGWLGQMEGKVDKADPTDGALMRRLGEEHRAKEGVLRKIGETEALLKIPDGEFRPCKVRYDAIGEKLGQLGEIQEELKDLADWLRQAEAGVANLDKASLIRKILLDQIQLVSEMEEEVEGKLRHAQSLPGGTPALDTQIRETCKRIEAVRTKVAKHADILNDVLKQLEHFERNADDLESWIHDAITRGAVNVKKEAKATLFKETIANGKRLIARKDVKDIHPVEERIRALEAAWNKLTEMGNALDAYTDLLKDFKNWLGQMEGKVDKADPTDAALMRRLADEHRAKEAALRKIGEMEAALKIPDGEFRPCKVRYDAIGDKLGALGEIQGELKDLADWLKQAEAGVAKLDKASLIREILDEQIQLVGEMDEEIESKLRHAQSLPGGTPALDAQIRETCKRIESLRGKVGKHAGLLNEVSKSLDHFNQNADDLETFVQEAMTHGLARVNKEAKASLFKETISHGKRLIARKDVKDIQPVEDRIRALEAAWDKLNEMGNAFDAYKNLLKDLKNWLGQMEQKVDKVDPADLNQIKRLGDEHKAKEPLLAKLREMEAALNIPPSDAEHRPCKGRYDAIGDKLGQLGQVNAASAQWKNDLKKIDASIGNLEDELHNMSPVGRTIRVVEGQVRDLEKWYEKWERAAEQVSEAESALDQLIRQGLASDPNGMKASLAQLNKRLSSIDAAGKKRFRDLEDALARLRKFYELFDEAMRDMDKGEKADLEKTGRKVEECNKLGEQLIKSAGKGVDTSQLERDLKSLNDKWNSLKSKLSEHEKALRDFRNALQQLANWLKKMEDLLSADGNVHGDVATVTKLIEQHQKIEREVTSRASLVTELLLSGEKLMSSPQTSSEEATRLRSTMQETKSKYEEVKRACDRRSRRLEEAMVAAKKLEAGVQSMLSFLSEMEGRMRRLQSDPLPSNEREAEVAQRKQDEFMSTFLAKESDKAEVLAFAREILAKAHPDAVPIIKRWIATIEGKWNDIHGWALQRQRELDEHMATLRGLEENLEALLRWLKKCEDTLVSRDAEPIPEEVQRVLDLIKEHKDFMQSMARKTGEVDAACKPAVPKSERGTTPTRGMRMKSPGPEGDHIGPRFERAGKEVLPQTKHPKALQVWDQWKHVWHLAWERQRKLQAALARAQELAKLRSFNWDAWRKRFVNYNQNKKERVMALFRGLDRSGDNIIPRDAFTDAIMRSRFPTDRIEMNAVADKFDLGDGTVDYMAFIYALNPDWREKGNEADVINDEIARQVEKCTCKQKFRVVQVAEGKYRFGTNQMLRLVRILRSTVMVRVGGGWESLDEFLLKHDPCRAQGRTNIELREQLALPEGVSQTMTAFHTKGRGEGPVTRVQERSERSTPMSRLSSRSPDRITPDRSSFMSGRSGRSPFGY